jgi:hypothetical protein
MARPGCKENIQISHEIPDIKGFKMGMLNIQSLPKHIDEVRILLADQCIDVLALY